MFDSCARDHWGIYVADVAERKPRKLVTNIADVLRPHWSRDGKWIYFQIQRNRQAGIYRCPASGGDAIVLAKDTDAINPQESLDGRTVYFASTYANSTLKQVALPPQPGAESEVDGLPRLSDADTWTLSPGGIYFVPAEAPNLSDTLISRPVGYAQLLKWTRISLLCRFRPMAVGYFLHNLAI